MQNRKLRLKIDIKDEQHELSYVLMDSGKFWKLLQLLISFYDLRVLSQWDVSNSE